MTSAIHPRFDLVVFDVAGATVMDGDAVSVCLRNALEPVVPVSESDVAGVMGLPKPVAIRQVLSTGPWRGDDLEAVVTVVHERFRSSLIAQYRAPGALAAAADAEHVFTVLRRAGTRVALDTGFSRDILDIVLDQLGWRRRGIVDVTVASDEVNRGRPHPDLIHRAMTLAGVDRVARVAKVGDTPSDLMEGLGAGCGLVVGVTCGTHSRDELQRPGVEIVDRLSEVLPLMGVAAA
jgi:phosphonatase-like hydrolase